MTERPHLSVSQLEMFAKCEMQWYFRYGLGQKRPPGVAAVIGKGTHKAIELDLGQKMAWGQLLEDDAVKDAAADATRKAWETETPVRNSDDPDLGQAVDAAISLASLHHKVLAPKLEPIALERAFLIAMPGIAHDLLGVVDVETPTHVRDTKTRSRAPSKDAAARSVQLAAYHLHALRAETAPAHKLAALDVLVRKAKPEAITLEHFVVEDEVRALTKRVELTSKSIESGIFRPASPGEWFCSRKWCGYFDQCDFGAKQSVSVGLIDPATLTSRIVPHPHADAQEDADVAA